MLIAFDPDKRERTLAARGLDFADAGEVFAGVHTVVEDVRVAYPERRFVSAGWLRTRLVVLVWTPIPGGRRVISMRYCHAKERARWLEALGRSG